MRKDKNLDELFRDKLLNYEQEPPAYILDNVLAGVAGARRKRKIVFWRMAGVAAALLLAFVAGWQFSLNEGKDLKHPMVVSQPKIAQPEVETKEAAIVAQIDEDKIPSESGIASLAFANKSKEIGRANSGSIVGRTAILQETELAGTTNESTLLKPLKGLYRLLKHDAEPDNSLQISKLNRVAGEFVQKSIDQQIMEQNQQLILSQNESEKKGRWLVGAQVSPEYNVSRSSHSQVYASNMISSSSNPVDLGGGISVEFKKGKRWSLQSGVYYSGMGQSSGNSSYSNRNLTVSSDLSTNHGQEYFNAAVNIDSKSSKMMMNSTAGVIEFSGVPSGIVLGTNLEDKTMASSAVVVSDTRFIQNFEYLEIPLYLRYTLIDSRFDVEMLGGFSSNMLVGNQTFMESNTGKSLIGSTKDMEAMNYSGTLGIGLKYGLSKRIYLNVEPRVKYYLNSLNSNSSVTYKPYTIGVFTGLSYEF